MSDQPLIAYNLKLSVLTIEQQLMARAHQGQALLAQINPNGQIQTWLSPDLRLPELLLMMEILEHRKRQFLEEGG